MNSNQDIKKERIKSYFMEAAKEIIMTDGVDGISVRRVAEKAGYSYATIYNYYQDLQALLWDVKMALVVELREYLINNIPKQQNQEDMKTIFYAYVSYYVKYPNIFKFFYLYPLENQKDSSDKLFSMFDCISLEAFQDFSSAKFPNAEIAAKTCIYAVHGMLMLFFSTNGMTKDTLHDDISELLDYLFSRTQ